MNTPAAVPRLITPGVIAAELRQPLHRVLRVLATWPHIRPVALTEPRGFTTAGPVKRVRYELNLIVGPAAAVGRCRNESPPTLAAGRRGRRRPPRRRARRPGQRQARPRPPLAPAPAFAR